MEIILGFMSLSTFLIFWFGFVIAIAVWAAKWNRSAFLWGIFAFFLSPLLAGIFLAICGQSGKRCYQCDEMVRKEALVCKHCGTDLRQSAMRTTSKFTDSPADRFLNTP